MSEIQFLNIDLEIESQTDLSPLIKEWGERVSVHRNEKVGDLYCGSFETGCSCIESVIEEYISLLNSLSSEAREVWDNLLKREFDFGYMSGISPNNFHSKISSESIIRIAKVGGSVVITIYSMLSHNKRIKMPLYGRDLHCVAFHSKKIINYFLTLYMGVMCKKAI